MRFFCAPTRLKMTKINKCKLFANSDSIRLSEFFYIFAAVILKPINIKMKKVLNIVFVGILVIHLSGCHTAKLSVNNLQVHPIEINQQISHQSTQAPNIHIIVNIEPAIASTPQDIFLYTSYNNNWHLLDSIRTDGNTTLKFKGYIPFQNEVELTFEKRGPIGISLILSPGDSITFDAPAESEIALSNEVEIPELSAQTEWNAYSRKNRILRNKADSLISLIVHTPKTDTLRLQALQKEFDTDSLAIHDMYVDLVKSSNPYIVTHSLLFLNIDYHEDHMYKTGMLNKFPDYQPLRQHYDLESVAKKTPGSRRIKTKINRIKKNRSISIQFSENVKKVNLKAGNKLALKLHQMNGDTQDLNMFKGKFVLVDFWASWCIPCINNLRPLIDIQKKYANKFEVCAITLDKLPAAWKRRIESLGMHNFHHFVGVDFSTGKLYPDIEALGFKTIPQNYLLDRDGKIIAINIYGEVLIKKLEELIKK